MDESYFRDKLSAYFDGDLPPEEMAMMEKYVAESEEARRILDEYRKLQEFVDAKSELVGEDYWERSAKKIEAAIGLDAATTVTEVQPRKNRWFRWRVVAAAASIAFLAFIGIHQTDIFKRVDEFLLPTETKQLPEKIAAPGPITPADDTPVTAVDEEIAAEPTDVTEDLDVAGYAGEEEQDKVQVLEGAAEDLGRAAATENLQALKEVDTTPPVEAKVEKTRSDIKPHSLTPPPPTRATEQAPAVPKPVPVAPAPEMPVVDKKKTVQTAAAATKGPVDKDVPAEAKADTERDIVIDIPEGDYLPDLSKSITVQAEPVSPLDTIAVSERRLVLNEYRVLRDSLEPQMPSVTKTVNEYMGVRPMAAKSNRAQLVESDEYTAYDREEPPQEDLAEALYYIAAFTDDDHEREHVMNMLRALAADNDSPAQDLAKGYLVDLQRFFEAEEADRK